MHGLFCAYTCIECLKKVNFTLNFSTEDTKIKDRDRTVN